MSGFVYTAYRIVSPLLEGIAQLAGRANPRLKSFTAVRNNLFQDLEQKLDAVPDPACRVWVHAASVGEFEQARPIIAELKHRCPETDIVVSFLSDSGFNARKNFPDASAVFYLPLDTPENARKLVTMLKPDVFLLMRYDFWPNHLAAIRTSGARLVLAAAVLREGSPYFNPLLKGFYRSIFMLFDRIFTVSRSDLTAFVDRFNCSHAEEAGDPRFDQVWLRSRLSEKEAGHLKPQFKNRMVLVGGSTWQPDEQILIPAWTEYREKISLVLVPHKVDPENIRRIALDLEKRNIAYEKISALTPAFNPEKQVLLVDQTGYLAELYTVASIAYVGGGFGVNVHNTLEPAVYGIPVLFGPRYGNSPEAAGLLECGAARLVHDERELAGMLGKMIGDPSLLKKAGTQAGEFVRQRLGATAAIAGAVAAYCMERKQEE